MSDDTTNRLKLPLLSAGQAQKELTHNEALTLIDMTVQPVVMAVEVNTPPPAPVAGQCWIVGAAPAGAWSGQANALAGWTAGGWRFVAPPEGCAVWSVADGAAARFLDGGWSTGVIRGARVEIDGTKVIGARLAAIAGPAGGATVDAEARTAIGAILAALREHGLIAA
ncbi:DUF2793 domain-containing protein [Sphingomonas immobilis]|uniref:DUF2793 domain-containing protein n=1 Tax=Sphingomonas immobilis TaxID=3063997 RepID=A0ABT9A3G6_9SPHN|nr:DUF2793 domain-containing protein [Sphingomonas sp. CA1-15]MDO7843755.1 DUF2793 domain-containing protein [Sphingomonas sp. CA1-15]